MHNRLPCRHIDALVSLTAVLSRHATLLPSRHVAWRDTERLSQVRSLPNSFFPALGRHSHLSRRFPPNGNVKLENYSFTVHFHINCSSWYVKQFTLRSHLELWEIHGDSSRCRSFLSFHSCNNRYPPVKNWIFLAVTCAFVASQCAYSSR